MPSQDTFSPHSGILANSQAGVAGDPAARMLGQYKKGATIQSIVGVPPQPTTFAPSGDGGAAVRNGAGGIRAHAKLGGLGAGQQGQIAPPSGFGGSDTGASGPSTSNSAVDGS